MLKLKSGDATLSRHKGINIQELSLHKKLAVTPSGESWRGTWQSNDIVAKFLAVRQCTPRISRDFNEEFPRLRIFSHPNVLPVIGCCNDPPNLIVINQYMIHGSLYAVLHQGTGLVVDTAQAIRFALDVTRGMAFLHSLEKQLPNFTLSSKHVMVMSCAANCNSTRNVTPICVFQIDEDLSARISMADAKFSFQDKGRCYSPQWIAPEALQKKGKEINVKSADMWSFAVLLWELATRQVPFAELSPMEAGLRVCFLPPQMHVKLITFLFFLNEQIALEGLRVSIPPGSSPHMAKLIRICMNEDPGKRPNFEMITPILEKMKLQ